MHIKTLTDAVAASSFSALADNTLGLAKPIKTTLQRTPQT